MNKDDSQDIYDLQAQQLQIHRIQIQHLTMDLLTWVLAVVQSQLVLAADQQSFNMPHDVGENMVFWKNTGGDTFEISEITYSGLNTFSGVPHVQCFEKDQGTESRYDIAILGAPLDTVSGSALSL